MAYSAAMIGALRGSVAAAVIAVLQAASPQGTPSQPAAPPVERLGDNLLRVGTVRVDTQKREISVAGTVNDVQILEFIAGAKGSFKAYETALELDTDAIAFNTALILIGLDKKNSVVPRYQQDPNPPKGDPVEVWVEWDERGKPRRIRAEELVYDEIKKHAMSGGEWVYTGSTFVADTNAYLAAVDGTLIGFVHTPSTIIDYTGPLVIGNYGANRFNPLLKLKSGTVVTLTVRALARK